MISSHKVKLLSRGRAIWAVAGLLSLFGGSALPCGPELPNQLMLHPSAAVLAMPPGDLSAELEALALPAAQRLPVVPAGGEPEKTTAAAELADLQQILPAALQPTAATLAAGLQHARLVPKAERQKLIASLPEEFRLYVDGAAEFRSGNLAAAQASWQKLLDLPASQRQYRSVWAAFMLGKLEAGRDKAAAERWFVQTRALAKQGFADRLGLAVTSLGWHAKLLFDAPSPESHAVALEMYAQQAQHLDPVAVVSVRLAARRLIDEPHGLAVAATLPLARAAMTAFLLDYDTEGSEPASDDYAWSVKWLDAVEPVQKAPALPLVGAERMAWLAYRAGQWQQAERWAALAKPDDALALWVRSKLQLRAGHRKEGTQLLRQALPGLPVAVTSPSDWDRQAYGHSETGAPPLRLKAMAELGILALGRQEFVGAFDQLARAG